MRFWKAYAIALGFVVLCGAAVTFPNQLFYKASGTGAVSRQMSSKLGDIVSVKDFGAVGDGVADDSTAVANAIAASGTNQVIGFDCPGSFKTTLYGTLPCGDYYPPLAFTGGVPRSLPVKIGDAMNVKDFGAKGDGTTDDTTAVTNACAAAAGRSLYFPEATYRITANSSCGATVTMLMENGASLSIDTGMTFTANGRVIALGSNAASGLGTFTYGNSVNVLANDLGFAVGTVPSRNSDDFVHIERNVNNSSGLNLYNQDLGASAQAYMHLWGGPASGGSQGSALRISASSAAAGALVNIVGENNTAMSIIQQTAAPLDLYTANVRQLQLASVPSAVNYWQFKGGLAASSISVNPAGTDTNISMILLSKGTGSLFFRTGGTGTPFQVEVTNTNSATNRITLTGGTNPVVGTSGGNLSLTASSNIVSAPSLSVTATTGGGTITLSSGTPSTGTATVNSGARCVCTNQTTQANPIKCAVSSTTLTATGPNTVTDVVAYFCF